MGQLRREPPAHSPRREPRLPLPDDARPILIIPAAGRGSRLDASTPKFLVPVLGQPMLLRLFGLYADHVSRFVVIVSPDALDTARTLARTVAARPVTICVQQQPTGMLDAVLLGRETVAPSGAWWAWVTGWDQVAVQEATVQQLVNLTSHS